MSFTTRDGTTYCSRCKQAIVKRDWRDLAKHDATCPGWQVKARKDAK